MSVGAGMLAQATATVLLAIADGVVPVRLMREPGLNVAVCPSGGG